MKRKLIEFIARITRAFHPRGTERILRLFFDPDEVSRKNWGFEAIVPYDDDLKIHVNPSSFIEWEIFFKRYCEPEISALVKKYLPRGGVFVDVGANIGAHALIGARIAKEVIAIEPVPYLVDRLRNNCELNRFKNVEILEMAASDKKGEFPFYLPGEPKSPSHKGIGSFFQEHAKGEKILVKADTLDNILGGRKVDMIKIDTEGHDGRVILGGLETIKRYLPTMIFEVAEDSWDRSINVGLILKMLQGLGYKTLLIKRGNLIPLSPGYPFHGDVLCIIRI